MLRHVMVLLLSFSFFGLQACGSSGGSAGERPPTLVNGRAFDAEIVGGTVSVYSFKNGKKGNLLGSAVTDEKGFYDLTIVSDSQYVLLELRGGSYTEEVSGKTVALREGQVLRAITFYQFQRSQNVMITPFTNIAAGFVKFKLAQGVPLPTAVTEAASAISSMVGVDILIVTPANITDPANVSTVFNQELKYGFMGAALSSWTAKASEDNGSEVHSIWTSIAFSQVMYRDIVEDGFLDGKGIDSDSKEVVDLGFGLVLIDANTYRSQLAQHLMGVVSSEVNQVDITLAQAVLEANRLANTTHKMFGGLPPGAFDEEGPVIIPIETEGSVKNGAFNFAVNVSDMVGVRSVVFDIDGGEIGQAAEPENPSFLINTTLYADGEYQIGVRAVDNLFNESYRQFTIQFLNSGSSIELTSSTWVNSSPASLSGSYIDNGAGIQSIVVDSVASEVDIENQTWSVEIPLENSASPLAFSKEVAFVTTDGLGVQKSTLITMMMDTLSPQFNPAPLYSDADFLNGETITRQNLSFAENPGLPLRIETDNASLNGVSLLEGPLSTANIPWIQLRAKDININDVFTPKDELIAEIQYSISGTVLTPWRALAPVITGNNDYRFLVPFVSEVLHEDWHLATPTDEHLIEVRIKDKAGNMADYSFQFKVEFVPPSPTTEFLKLSDAFSVPFAQRGSLYNQVLPVAEYRIRNNTNKSMLFSIADASRTHIVWHHYEEEQPNASIEELNHGHGFLDDHFEVLNEVGSPAIATEGFFRLLPGEAYTVVQFVKTPDVSLYDDTEVGNPEIFASNVPKRYDKKIDWRIITKFDITTVHDTGFEKAAEMVAVNYESQTTRSFAQFILSR